MGWPKGVPRKKNDVITVQKTGFDAGAIGVNSDHGFIRYDAIFAIRFLRKDSLFPGLWELVKLDQNMKRVKVITDANARGQVQTLLMREVKRIVV